MPSKSSTGFDPSLHTVPSSAAGPGISALQGPNSKTSFALNSQPLLVKVQINIFRFIMKGNVQPEEVQRT